MILVVDDSPLNCEVIKGNLVTAGYSVFTACNGADAIDVCKEKQPDLVLLDIIMPGMSGIETCRHLRSMPQGADVPIVFLSSLNDLDSHQKALDAGGDDVLTKPIHRSELILRARSMIWLKKLRTELRSGYNLISSQRDALIRAQAQKQELIDLIVHDLKSPLQVVFGFAQQLETRPEVATSAELMDLVRRITGSAEMMQRMVLNMLDISLSETGSLRPNLSDTDVHKIAQDAIQSAGMKAKQRSVTLGLEAPPAFPLIAADAGLVRRLLDNLIDNALRYSPKNTKVVVELKKPDDLDPCVTISVRDEGPGIPEAERDTIFEKYFRLRRDDHGARSSFNYGLGLTFCRLAAQAHGGRIWIEDNKPSGAIFRVAIPSGARGREEEPIVMS